MKIYDNIDLCVLPFASYHYPIVCFVSRNVTTHLHTMPDGLVSYISYQKIVVILSSFLLRGIDFQERLPGRMSNLPLWDDGKNLGDSFVRGRGRHE